MKKNLFYFFSVAIAGLLWTACTEEAMTPKNDSVVTDANAKKGKPTPGAYTVTSSIDGYTLIINIDQSAAQAASHMLLQLTDCDGNFVTSNAVVSSSIPVNYSTGNGTGCAYEEGAFIKFDNLDVFQTQGSFTISITFNIPILSGSIKVKSATNCFDFPLNFESNCDTEISDPKTETAFAYGEGYATCFDQLNFERWGWTNGGYAEGLYTLDIYAGAGQCDLEKGTWVGTLLVEYSMGTAVITYNIDTAYKLYETHVYVGSAALPVACKTAKGVTTCSSTVAPGQYPQIDGTGTVTSYTFTGLSGAINVVAHAVVGDF